MTATLTRSESQLIAGPSSSDPVVLGAAPTDAAVCFLAVRHGVGATPVSSVSQTGVSWTKMCESLVTANISLWRGEVSTGASATLTAALGASIAGNHIYGFWEFAVSSQGGTIGAQSTGTSATSTTIATPTVTFPDGGDYILIGIGDVNGSGSYVSGPSNGFTALTSAGTVVRFGHKIVDGASGTDSTSWLFGTSNAYDSCIGMYRTANAPASGQPTMRRFSLMEIGRSGVKFAATQGREGLVVMRHAPLIVPETIIRRRAA